MNKLTSHMIAPIALLYTPRTPRTALRGLRNQLLARHFFRLFKLLVRSVLVFTTRLALMP